MSTQTPISNHLASHLDWSIVQTGDGIICLDPRGSHVLPGGVTHESVHSARKSIDAYILADGNAHRFWLLLGRSGHDHVARRNINTDIHGNITNIISKRDNPNYEPIYEYEHVVHVDRKTGMIDIQSNLDVHNLTPESALALANVLRDAAVQSLNK